MSQKGFTPIILILGLLIVVFIFLGLYYFGPFKSQLNCMGSYESCIHLNQFYTNQATPTPQPLYSQLGSFLRFGEISGRKEIVIKTSNGTEYGYPLGSNIEYTVSPPNLKVDESYLQLGDQLNVNTVQPLGGYQTAISVVIYTKHPDLKSHLVMSNITAGVTQEDLTYTDLSDTTSWKIYNKNFNGIHYYFKYPGNFQYSDEDSSSPILFSQRDEAGQQQDGFHIDSYYNTEALDQNSFLVWYRINVSLNYGDTLTKIQTIHLPKNTVYKLTFTNLSKSSFNKYTVPAGKTALILTKSDFVSEKDLFSLINTLNAYCLIDCPK